MQNEKKMGNFCTTKIVKKKRNKGVLNGAEEKRIDKIYDLFFRFY